MTIKRVLDYTHNKYCDLLLTLDAYDIRAHSDVQKYALRWPGRRHPDRVFDDLSSVHMGHEV